MGGEQKVGRGDSPQAPVYIPRRAPGVPGAAPALRPKSGKYLCVVQRRIASPDSLGSLSPSLSANVTPSARSSSFFAPGVQTSFLHSRVNSGRTNDSETCFTLHGHFSEKAGIKMARGPSRYATLFPRASHSQSFPSCLRYASPRRINPIIGLMLGLDRPIHDRMVETRARSRGKLCSYGSW